MTLDIDKSVKPNLVDKLPELSQVESNSFDAVYSAHNIEHLYPHEVPLALKAMHRVLKPDGFVILTCPDLQTIGERLASGDIETPLYTSSSGPISPIDMMYGFRPSMKRGNLYMAHHTGFTIKSLGKACVGSGFSKFFGLRRPKRYDLWALATKAQMSDEKIQELGKIYLTPV
ncbi:SAM-dependent methyltransferase [Microvirga lupini]|uniref:SAM-dependent methyltransferase n=1 Tax=Microvirga lupini TaxID=420324 RepID=A0A7W4YXP6_9HYPH|nr:SAM-dependent methyltransferase [Microvirga lupini]